MPVKTTNDLLVLRSDVYDIGRDFVLDQNTDSVPFIELDSDHYALVDEFDKRFPEGAPSLSEATSLKVEGDWTFGKGVQVVGDVELSALSRASGCRRRPCSPRTPVPERPDPLRSFDEHLAAILDDHRTAARVRPAAARRARPGVRRRGRLRHRPAALRQLRDGRLRRAAPRRRHRHRRVAGHAAGDRRDRCRADRRHRPAGRHRRQDHDRGARSPTGADAVVPYEWTDRGSQRGLDRPGARRRASTCATPARTSARR